MSTFAQMSDLCSTMERSRPLHIVAEARGPLLEDFTEKIHDLRSHDARSKLVTSDVLPTEEMTAGFMAQCAMQPQLSSILKVLPIHSYFYL
jgi:hypothetical protein